MKIALFGASGGTGKLLLERCLSAGYEVTALFRSPPPPNMLFTHPASAAQSAEILEPNPETSRLHIVRGDAFDPDAVRQTIEGADVVLSALGARSLKREDVLERAVPILIDAMQQTLLHAKPVRRIIVLGSAGALPTALEKQPAWRRWIVQNLVYNTFLKWPVASQISQWNDLSHSDLDWTMVMPPMLTNTPAHGSYRVDGEALPRNGSRISRQDVADFMIQQIADPQWIRKGVYLTW